MNNNGKKNKIYDKAFSAFGLICTISGLLVLLLLVWDVLSKGAGRVSLDFITGLPSRIPENAGILTPLIGSAWILILTGFIAFPLGVAAAIHLEEYGYKNRWSRILEVNIANLAGVPSIIYGLLGLQVFSRGAGLGGSLLTGAFTLSLLVLPIIIVATREAIRSVPNSIREASFAMGASRWQTIWMQVLPASMGGIFTGVILALSRAVGETAPLIVIGALTYVAFVPSGPMDEFSVLPIQIFNWVSRPQQGFMINAAAGIILLLLLTFIMNGFAVYLRNKWHKKVNW